MLDSFAVVAVSISTRVICLRLAKEEETKKSKHYNIESAKLSEA